MLFSGLCYLSPSAFCKGNCFMGPSVCPGTKSTGRPLGWLRTKEKELWCERQNPQSVHFRPLPLASVAPGRKVPCSRNVKQSTVPGAIKSSGSAASMEGRQLQRFHFHLDFKQLYKRASVLVKLILSLVGLGWWLYPAVSTQRLESRSVCVCVHVPKHSLYL